MIEKWIHGLARVKWLVVVLWVVLTAASVLTLPNLTVIAKQTESKFLPSDSESLLANNLQSKISTGDQEKSNAILVLYRKDGLTQADHQWMQNKIKALTGDEKSLDIVAIHSAYDDPQLANNFLSQDKTTELAEIGLAHSENDGRAQSAVEQIRAKIKDAPSGTEANLTGSAPIMKDYTDTSQNGLSKTEVLTIVLVLGILLAVFRSPIAPLIPLVTIALSFLFARGFIALGTRYGLPVSTFTETFLVAVLFGAGTDYCILLIHRFREELSKGFDRVQAMVNTMRTVGKTVVFSASTVLIAFFLLGFAKFGLYQSAVGVSIGMLMTLLAGLTLAPSLLLILGPKLYWPFKIKPGAGHGESKFWGALAKQVSRRPLLVLLIAVLVLSPLIALFRGDRSFDDLAEIDPSIGSVKGFRTVENAFSPGEIMPVTFTLTSSNSMRTAAGLAAIEQASAMAAKMPDVAEVRSAARPLGKQLDQLTIPQELNQSTKALGDVQSGVSQVANGLGQAQTQVQAGAKGIDQMHAGLNQIAEKQSEVASGTSQIAQGTAKVASGLTQGVNSLQTTVLPGLQQLQQNEALLAGKTLDAQKGLQQLQGGLTQSQQGLAQLNQGVGLLQTTAASMSGDLNNLLQAHPELKNDPSVLALLQKQQGLAQGLAQTAKGFQPLTQGLTQVNGGLGQAADGLGQLADGQTKIAGGIGQLQGGLQTFAGQMQKGTSALNQLSTGAGQAADGLNQLADGTKLLNGKVLDLQSGLGQMATGLGSGKDALGKVNDGLSQIQTGQQGIVDNAAKQLPGWYIPDSALQNADMKKALDTYISADGKIAKFDVVLSINPYSQQAMDSVAAIKNALQQSLNHSAIEHPVLYATGTTAQNQELSNVSNHDFWRTGGLIVLGIFLVLALLLRSIVAPIYILASLLFSYGVTMGVVELVYVKILGHPGLSWTVPFFTFILLVALGVDYSIFLMARFREEYRPGGVVAAMQKAMTTTGGVILSAAVIMGGTFGAMIFSGVGSMMQIGTAIVIGLAIYTTIVLGLIVPSLAMLFGEGNWWPLKRSKAKPGTTANANVSTTTSL